MTTRQSKSTKEASFAAPAEQHVNKKAKVEKDVTGSAKMDTGDDFEMEDALDADAMEQQPEGFSTNMITHSLAELNIEDIDECDHDNPMLCAAYVNDIYGYLWDLERKFQVDHEYMTRQHDVSCAICCDELC